MPPSPLRRPDHPAAFLPPVNNDAFGKLIGAFC